MLKILAYHPIYKHQGFIKILPDKMQQNLLNQSLFAALKSL